jgi:hypothetical protein
MVEFERVELVRQNSCCRNNHHSVERKYTSHEIFVSWKAISKKTSAGIRNPVHL